MDATTLVSEFNALILQLSSAFTQPTVEAFRQLAAGRILTPGTPTVTGMIRTLGLLANKHWTVYGKFFYRSSRSPQDLGRLILLKVIAPLLGDHLDLVIDDSTCGPRGRRGSGRLVQGRLGRGDKALAGCPRGGATVFCTLEVVIIEIDGLDAARLPDPKLGLTLLRIAAPSSVK